MDFPIAREIDEQYEQNCVICTAPSKTFNIAGLQVSNIFISNKNYAAAPQAGSGSSYSQVNTLGLVACQAAYTYGEDWLQQVKTYIEDNIEFVDAYLKQNLPQIKLLRPEGTYLIWLDCSALALQLPNASSGSGIKHISGLMAAASSARKAKPLNVSTLPAPVHYYYRDWSS